MNFSKFALCLTIVLSIIGIILLKIKIMFGIFLCVVGLFLFVFLGLELFQHKVERKDKNGRCR